MSNKLYRKVIHKSGAVRYEEIFQWDEGDPADGVWYIKKEGGRKFRWITEKLSELPQALAAATLVPHESKIIKELSTLLASKGYTIKDIIDAVAKAIGKNEYSTNYKKGPV